MNRRRQGWALWGMAGWAALFTLVWAGTAAATRGQEPDSSATAGSSSRPEAPEPRAWCFLAEPAPRCRSYPILEVRGTWGLASTVLPRPIGPDRRAFDEFNLEFTLGHVVNLTPRWGAGAGITLGTNVGGFDGARARVRYWASEAVSVEADVGMIRTNLGSYAPVSTGPSVGLRANLFDVGTLGVRYDAVNVPATEFLPGGWQSGLSVTGGFAGPTAIVASGLIGIGVAAFIIAFAGIAL